MIKWENKDVKAIFFDQGGVIMGVRKMNPETRESNLKRMMKMVGVQESCDNFMKRVRGGEDKYKAWGMESLIECSAAEIWSRWILPEIPMEKLAPIAEELTLLYFEARGHRVADENIKEVALTLKRRGYIVGVISNSWSRPLVHQEIKREGLEGIFDIVVLSSETEIRKPDQKIFLQALENFDINPEQAVYVGDQPNRDVPGPRNAGFALTILLRTKKLKPEHMEKPEHQPDLIIESLTELLDMFKDI